MHQSKENLESLCWALKKKRLRDQFSVTIIALATRPKANHLKCLLPRSLPKFIWDYQNRNDPSRRNLGGGAPGPIICRWRLVGVSRWLCLYREQSFMWGILMNLRCTTQAHEAYRRLFGTIRTEVAAWNICSSSFMWVSTVWSCTVQLGRLSCGRGIR